MDIDQAVKLILAIAFAASMLMVAYQLGRLLGKLADTVEDARKGVQNFSKASDMVLEDYGKIRREIDAVLGFVSRLRSDIFTPISKILGFLGVMDRVPFFGGKQQQPNPTSPTEQSEPSE